MRLVVDEARRAEIHLLATLGDHDDAWMVGRPARRGRGSPPVEAHAGNLCCPILFLAHEGGNLAREFRAQPAGRVWFQSGVFFMFFMSATCAVLSKDSRLARSIAIDFSPDKRNRQ